MAIVSFPLSFTIYEILTIEMFMILILTFTMCQGQMRERARTTSYRMAKVKFALSVTVNEILAKLSNVRSFTLKMKVNLNEELNWTSIANVRTGIDDLIKMCAARQHKLTIYRLKTYIHQYSFQSE